jgi:hypothetical protein
VAASPRVNGPHAPDSRLGEYKTYVGPRGLRERRVVLSFVMVIGFGALCLFGLGATPDQRASFQGPSAGLLWWPVWLGAAAIWAWQFLVWVRELANPDRLVVGQYGLRYRRFGRSLEVLWPDVESVDLTSRMYVRVGIKSGSDVGWRRPSGVTVKAVEALSIDSGRFGLRPADLALVVGEGRSRSRSRAIPTQTRD